MSQDQKIQQNVASSFGNHFDEKGTLITQIELKYSNMCWWLLNAMWHAWMNQCTIMDWCSPFYLYCVGKGLHELSFVLHVSLKLFFLYALVVVIGDQELPKISTQALKQQHEKNIEEATPSKHIKVMKVHDHTTNPVLSPNNQSDVQYYMKTSHFFKHLRADSQDIYISGNRKTRCTILCDTLLKRLKCYWFFLSFIPLITNPYLIKIM